MATLKSPDTAYNSLKSHEGFQPTARMDTWTGNGASSGLAVGIGQHQIVDPNTGRIRDVQPGDVVTEQYIKDTFGQSSQPFVNGITAKIGEDRWNELSAGQQNALLGMSWNYGAGGWNVKGPDGTRLADAVINRDDAKVAEIISSQSANPSIRQQEADQYLNNKDTIGGAAGGASGAGGAAGAAGSGGSGAACAAAGFAGILSIASAGIMGALGMAAGGPLAGLGTAINAVGGIGAVAQAGIGLATGQGIGALSGLLGNLGSAIAPGLGNVIPIAMAAASGQLSGAALLQGAGAAVGGNLGSIMSAAGGIAGLVSQIGKNQTGAFTNATTGAKGTPANLINNIYQVQGAIGQAKPIVASTAEAMQQTFGSGTSGMGPLVRNNDNIVTYTTSALTPNLPGLATDLINVGAWDAKNPTRIMQPGNIAAQIVSRGLGTQTGILTMLANADPIPIGAMDSSEYDAKIQTILNQITSPAAVNAVRAEFKVALPLDNLGQLTDFRYMMPNSWRQCTVGTWLDFGMMLINMQLTLAEDLRQLGTTLSKVETTQDLAHLSNLKTPFYKPAGDLILDTWGYGSGAYGELTMADFFGSSAGYVHEDTWPVIIDNINYLQTKTESKQYFDGTMFLLHFSQDKYTTATTSDGGDGTTATTTTYTYTVPKGETGYTDGFIGTFTDSATNTPVSGNPHQYTNGTPTTSGKEAAVKALITYIEAGMTTLVNSTDINIKNAVDNINTAHAASVAQVLRELHLWDLFKISTFDTTPGSPSYYQSFANSLGYLGMDTGHGKSADLIERLSQDNLYGDAIKATMRMSRNAMLLQPLGVNVDRFFLPQSQYYTDPQGLMKSLYDGLVPPPINQQPVNYPLDPTAQYIVHRDALLIKNGYNDRYTEAQKNYYYINVYWQGQDPTVLEGIGKTAVYTAVARNIYIVGNSIEMVDLANNRFTIATITADGIVDFNSDLFLNTMFMIVNRILYGSIAIDDISNPFSTEDIIYAAAEMLSSITSENMDQLLNTIMGQEVLKTLLTSLYRRFKPFNTAFDTAMDRNIHGAYGGSGPSVDRNQP